MCVLSEEHQEQFEREGDLTAIMGMLDTLPSRSLKALSEVLLDELGDAGSTDCPVASATKEAIQGLLRRLSPANVRAAREILEAHVRDRSLG